MDFNYDERNSRENFGWKNQDIRKVKLLYKYRNTKIGGCKIMKHARSDDETEKNKLFSSKLEPNAIIIATNLAGRGTDIEKMEDYM